MTVQDASSDRQVLVLALKSALAAAGHSVLLFETHISWVLALEEFAYKFKKPVRFDFLDFTSLDARRHFCEEELQLNQRLAPDLYLAVVPVTGSIRQPCLDGPGEPIEFAVKMHAFHQDDLWANRIATGRCSVEDADELARLIAAFHLAADVAPAERPWGNPQVIRAVAEDNYARICALATDAHDLQRITALRQWENAQAAWLDGRFMQRKAAGAVRECHGDLHSRNILTLEPGSRVMAFDCIEFNAAMRWIDVMNDIAFTCMDLHCLGRADLASRFLSQYLEQTGDFAGLSVLDYYQRHRALIRCKVDLLRAAQLPAQQQEAEECRRQASDYLAFAANTMQTSRSAIMITHGYSGSGKSTLAGELVAITGALRVRSDVERKRMFGRAGLSQSEADLATGLYDPAITRQTYARLQAIARDVVAAGYSVIVDAAFLKREQREAFACLAAELKVPFFILAVRADETCMRARLAQRVSRQDDPSDAGPEVLDYQLRHSDPLTDSERQHAIDFTMDRGIDDTAVLRLTQRLGLDRK